MFAALFAALAMASAALAPAQEAVVEKSIADLRNHRPAFEAVRNVRLTTVHDLDGAPRQLVCGEVRLGDRWDPFGSRETMSGYEHLVGGLARS